MSLADDVLDALLAVRQIGESLDNEHPMRHVVRDLKRVAESAITDAMKQATAIAYQAKALLEDHDAAVAAPTDDRP